MESAAEDGPVTPIFRWMGSKRRQARTVAHLVKVLAGDGTYFEPFLGSGSVALAARTRASVLGDVNAELMNAWSVLRDRPSDLHRAVAGLASDAETYYAVRDSIGDGGSFARAVRFVYLNRYCFNGIYRTNRANVFNVPFGQATGALPSREAFVACAEAVSDVKLVHQDFEATLDTAKDGDVAYLDPPFPTTRPTYGEYGYGSFSVADLQRFQACIEDLTARSVAILISLPRRHAESYFSSLRRRLTTINYSVASRSNYRRQTEEALLLNAAAQDALADRSCGGSGW